MNRLKRLVRPSNGVKPRYIQEMLNQINMSISAEHLPDSSIKCAGITPFASETPSTGNRVPLTRVLTRRKVFPRELVLRGRLKG